MDHLHAHAPETPLASTDLQALQALAEPNRSRIVELLGHGEHCVCDVGGALELSSALVSHHLRVLRVAGLVNERRDGRWVHYSLDTERLARVRATLVTLLTPTEAASAACVHSDCGTHDDEGRWRGRRTVQSHRIRTMNSNSPQEHAR